MPIYEYQCKNCGHTFDELQSIKENPLVTCPKCGKDTLARLIGTGSGIIFKGSGFYQTDYKKSSSSESKSTDKDPGIVYDSKDKSKSENKTESKPTSQTEKKADKKESKKK
jgi:putative FmdB family regulatory protein